MTLTRTGTDRYSPLWGYFGGSGGCGIVDFSPIGLPVLVTRMSVPAGIFSSIGDNRYDYCFAAGTLVLMADGSRKPIETIAAREGRTSSPPDYDPEGPAKNCPVLEVYRNAPARILHVRVAGQIIRATFNHPFYVRGKGWTAAEKLQAGDRLLAHEGSWARVEGTEDSGQIEPVFNLHVEASQTYFVAASEDGPAVLVHNSSAGVVKNPVGNFLDFITFSVISSVREGVKAGDLNRQLQNSSMAQLGSAKGGDADAVNTQVRYGTGNAAVVASTNLIHATSSVTSLGLGTGGPSVAPSMASGAVVGAEKTAATDTERAAATATERGAAADGKAVKSTGHSADWELRNGDGTISNRGTMQSGSVTPPGRRLTWPEQLDTHTEAKILNDLKGTVKRGDIITIRGTKPPCNPGGQGCQSAMDTFAKEHGVTIYYTDTTTGKVWTFRN